MEANVGVISETVSVKTVDTCTPRMPMPTPMMAEISGMPAATKEPKVISSTIAATMRPIISALPPISWPAELKALPWYFTVSSPSSYLLRTSVTLVMSSSGMSMTSLALKVIVTVPVVLSSLSGESCCRFF